jgi:hypothetical protein
LLSCSPRVAVRPGGEFIVGLPGLTAEWGALWLTLPWLWVFVYAPRIHSVLSGWLVQSGLGRFLSSSFLRVSAQCSASWPDGSTCWGLETTVAHHYYYFQDPADGRQGATCEALGSGCSENRTLSSYHVSLTGLVPQGRAHAPPRASPSQYLPTFTPIETAERDVGPARLRTSRTYAERIISAGWGDSCQPMCGIYCEMRP